MKCVDCVAKKGPIINEAEWVLLGDVTSDYEILLLCYDCFHEYIHGFGEVDLEYFSIDEFVLSKLVKEVNQKYKYLNEMYSRLLKKYSAQKKQIADLTNRGDNDG